MSASSLLELAPVPADARIPYGSDPNQFGDLFLPAKPAGAPALLHLHGGYWRARYDLLHASRFCRALAESGIAVWCLEYRRVGNPGGGWPGTFEDVLSGWKALPGIASKHRLDLSRAAVAGHSAGAQLALVLASRKLDLAPSAVFSLAGVVDLERAFALHLSNDAVVEFLGGTPERVPDHYKEADPMRLSLSPHQLLFHGEPDDAVPFALSRQYVETKKAAGEAVELFASSTAGHFDWIDPRTHEFARVREQIQAHTHATGGKEAP